MKTTRREFVKRSMFAAAASLSVASAHQTFAESGRPPVNINDIDDHTISVFSKNLQWLDYDNMAKVAAEIGFDGIDLTVRPNGHVLPERVAEDLPKAVRAVRSAGLEVYTITTAISEASHEHTEAIVASASELGIGHYRMNWLAYDKSLSVSQNLGNFKTKLDELAKLNEKYNIHGAYQNHAGLSLGSPLWDLWMLIKDIDPRWLGCQYDVRHATVEGGNSWPLGLKLIHPHIRTTVIKDFYWSREGQNWKEKNVPLGQGMVDFKLYFDLIREHQIKGPISMHFEYALGGAEQGSKTLSVKPSEIKAAMRKDLLMLKSWL